MEAGDDLQEIKEFRGDVSRDGTSTLLVKLSELPRFSFMIRHKHDPSQARDEFKTCQV
jgi:hypothetical protein